MSGTVSEVIGVRQAQRALRNLPASVKEDLQQEMDVTASRVQGLAAAKVRRRTGFLLGRIRWRSRPKSLSAVVGIDGDAYYWKFLERGTVNMPASPFIGPAAEAMKDDHQRRLMKVLTESLQDMEKEAGSPAV